MPVFGLSASSGSPYSFKTTDTTTSAPLRGYTIRKTTCPQEKKNNQKLGGPNHRWKKNKNLNMYPFFLPGLCSLRPFSQLYIKEKEEEEKKNTVEVIVKEEEEEEEESKKETREER